MTWQAMGGIKVAGKVHCGVRGQLAGSLKFIVEYKNGGPLATPASKATRQMVPPIWHVSLPPKGSAAKSFTDCAVEVIDNACKLWA